PEHKVQFEAPVVLASAPAPKPNQAPIGQSEVDDSGAPAGAPVSTMLHQASLKTETREVPVKSVVAAAQPAVPKSTDRPATAASPVNKKSVDKPGLAAAKPVTKPVQLAKNDPLAPLSDKRSTKTSRDHPPAQ